MGNRFQVLLDRVKRDLYEYEQELAAVDRTFSGNTQDEIDAHALQLQPGFNRLFNHHLDLLEQHALGLPKRQRMVEGRLLRSAFERFISQAPFMHRTNVKPRGYMGDSEMMRMLYENKCSGETLFGKLLHKHILETSAADAVRNRRIFITNELRQRAHSHASLDPIDILSVACGPAREIADLVGRPEDSWRFRTTLLDQDEEALKQAQIDINGTEEHYSEDGKPTVRYLKQSIGMLMRPGKERDRLGQFDFIYSMGLYDYLDAQTARKLTTSLLSLLKPGGTLLVGNYSAANTSRVYIEYWCDWWLIHRTEEELLEFVGPDHRKSHDITVELDASGSQFFLRALKKAPVLARL